MEKDKKISTKELLLKMTLEEKIALVSGTDFMYTNSIPRLNIPPIRMSDGPHGLRVQIGNGDNGVDSSLPATSFPTASLLANTWNKDLIYKVGETLAKEAKHFGVNVILGPGVNIKRNPLCGRNFEYFSEDPFLTSEIASAEIKGIEDQNVAACVKHFALNNQENYRFMGNSIVDKRAQREIYLKQFEYIVKNTNLSSIMCSYNKINGIYSSENKELLTDILRDEWGFKGTVISDWGATFSREKGILAGLDLEMPGDALINRKIIYDAIKNKTLDEEKLNESCLRILDLIYNHQNEINKVDFDSHHELAKLVAEEGIVLLKNENDILPLKEDESYLIIGELFEKMRYQGSGSSMINPYKLTTFKDAFDEHKINYKYLKGYHENKNEIDNSLIEDSIKELDKYQKIILFLGLTDYYESEGEDRHNLSLPLNQLELMKALKNKNKDLIVVLIGGSSFEIPFINDIKGLLNIYLSGENAGNATYNILFGKTNPSGRLNESWVKSINDIPFINEYSKNKNEIYKESIFVGYRYYLTKNIDLLFPFGFGLSYSKFEYDNFKVTKEDDLINIDLDIKNISNIEGKEVIQIYVKKPQSKISKPLRELVAFTKINLLPNETKHVSLKIDLDQLKYYSRTKDGFILEEGIYQFELGKDSNNILFKEEIFILADIIKEDYDDLIYQNLDFDKLTNQEYQRIWNINLPKNEKALPITLESRFTDLKLTFFGKILYKAVISVSEKKMKKALKMEDGPLKDNKIKGAYFLRRILDSNSIITLSMSSSNNFPFNIALGFVELSNGHILKALKHFLTKIKAPSLPKEKGGK